MTVSYPSVRKGVNRLDFMLSVKHALSMIKNIDKFKGSIGLIVTKVDNVYRRQGNTFRLVPDETVIENIVDFIKSVRDELKITSFYDKNFNEIAVKFINILLDTNGQTYTKIGIFRRPDDSGPLSGITLLQEGKVPLKKILHENLLFSSHNK